MTRLTTAEIDGARPKFGVRVSPRPGCDGEFVVACGRCDYVELVRHSPRAAAEERARYHRSRHVRRAVNR